MAPGATHLALLLLDPLCLCPQAAQGGWEVKEQGDWKSGSRGPSPAGAALHKALTLTHPVAHLQE